MYESKAIDRLTWNTLNKLIIIIINTMIIFNAGILLLLFSYNPSKLL